MIKYWLLIVRYEFGNLEVVIMDLGLGMGLGVEEGVKEGGRRVV